MRDILKRIFIGVVIGMALFFLKSQVFAYSLDQDFISNYHFFNSVKQSYITISDSTTSTQTQTNLTFDYVALAPANSEFLIFNTTYAFENAFTNQGNNSITNIEFYLVSSLIINAQIISQESGYSSICEFSNNAIICPVTPGIHYTGLRILTVHFNSATYSCLYLNISTYNGFYKRHKSSETTAIENQTSSLLDSDSTANKSYNNDYSNTDFDEAEENLDSYVDVDVSDVVFDPLAWVTAFSYIWSVVSSFVVTNSKVFTCLTSFLTISFVGLVFGR